MSSLQTYHWVSQQKNFENRLTFGEVMAKSLVSCFVDSQCSFVAANQYCHDDDTRDQGTKILCVIWFGLVWVEFNAPPDTV